MTSTINYGAITKIIDNRVTYSMIDSTQTNFIFEVYPINIDQDEINKAIQSSGIPNFWFIAYNTDIIEPTKSDIDKAINEGLLIKLSIKCTIIDNFGVLHSLEFNNDTEKYKIKINNLIYIHNNSKRLIRLSDLLIDHIKESNNVEINLYSFSSSYFLFGKLLDKIKYLEERVKILEEK